MTEVIKAYTRLTDDLNICLLPNFVIDEENKSLLPLSRYMVAVNSKGGSIHLDFAKIEVSNEVLFINLQEEWTEENAAQLTYAFVLGKKISFLKEENIPRFYQDLIEKKAEAYEI